MLWRRVYGARNGVMRALDVSRFPHLTTSSTTNRELPPKKIANAPQLRFRPTTASWYSFTDCTAPSGPQRRNLGNRTRRSTDSCTVSSVSAAHTVSSWIALPAWLGHFTTSRIPCVCNFTHTTSLGLQSDVRRRPSTRSCCGIRAYPPFSPLRLDQNAFHDLPGQRKKLLRCQRLCFPR